MKIEYKYILDSEMSEYIDYFGSPSYVLYNNFMGYGEKIVDSITYVTIRVVHSSVEIYQRIKEYASDNGFDIFIGNEYNDSKGLNFPLMVLLEGDMKSRVVQEYINDIHLMVSDYEYMRVIECINIARLVWYIRPIIPVDFIADMYNIIMTLETPRDDIMFMVKTDLDTSNSDHVLNDLKEYLVIGEQGYIGFKNNMTFNDYRYVTGLFSLSGISISDVIYLNLDRYEKFKDFLNGFKTVNINSLKYEQFLR